MSDDVFNDIDEELDRIGIDTRPERIPIVHAIFVQDHSGSMSADAGNGSARSQLAMNNYNEQLAKIQRESSEVETTISIIEFDDRVQEYAETTLAQNIKPMLTWWTGGSTALRDAIGESIVKGKSLISGDSDKDQSVLVIVLTDGEENDSKEWTDEQIKKEIKYLEDSGIWTFTFMGGELQANEAITKMGFLGNNTMYYTANDEGFKMSAGKTMSGLDKYYTVRKAGETQVDDFFVDEEEKAAWQNITKDNS